MTGVCTPVSLIKVAPARTCTAEPAPWARCLFRRGLRLPSHRRTLHLSSSGFAGHNGRNLQVCALGNDSSLARALEPQRDIVRFRGALVISHLVGARCAVAFQPCLHKRSRCSAVAALRHETRQCRRRKCCPGPNRRERRGVASAARHAGALLECGAAGSEWCGRHVTCVCRPPAAERRRRQGWPTRERAAVRVCHEQCLALP